MIIKGKEITDLEKIKNIELRILFFVTNFCVEHDLKYFLAYGTLLGAVRHKGFIPWDDDIDIMMPRHDYNKFIKLWKNSNKYKLSECTIDKKYIYPFAKVYDNDTYLEEHDVAVSCDLGIYIDIFPYDGIKKESVGCSHFLKKCSFLEKCRLYSMLSVEKFLHKNHHKNWWRYPIWRILRAIGPAKFSRMINRYSQKYDLSKSDFAGCVCNRNLNKEILFASDIDNSINMEFENQIFKVPEGYDRILHTWYGDYLTPPPKELQCLAHNFKVWERRYNG